MIQKTSRRDTSLATEMERRAHYIRKLNKILCDYRGSQKTNQNLKNELKKSKDQVAELCSRITKLKKAANDAANDECVEIPYIVID